MAVLGARERQRVHGELALGALGRVAVGQEVDADAPVRQRRGPLDGLGDAAHRVRTDHDAVDHDLDGMAELLVELDRIIERANLAVDADAAEALAPEVVEELGELALAVGHHRREHERPPALPRLEDLVGDLVGGLARDLAAALGAVGDADAGEQKAQVVVDLGDGSHRGARVFARRLLVDGHGRAEGRRSSRGRACPSAPGTGGRSSRGSRRSGAGPRRIWCRTRGSTCPTPTGPLPRRACRAGCRRLCRAGCARGRRGSRWLTRTCASRSPFLADGAPPSIRGGHAAGVCRPLSLAPYGGGADAPFCLHRLSKACSIVRATHCAHSTWVQ